MGHEEVGPSPDQQESPLVRLDSSIQRVVTMNGAEASVGAHRALLVSLVRRVLQDARDVVSSPIDPEKPPVQQAVSYLGEEYPVFAECFRGEINQAAQGIAEEESRGES